MIKMNNIHIVFVDLARTRLVTSYDYLAKIKQGQYARQVY